MFPIGITNNITLTIVLRPTSIRRELFENATETAVHLDSGVGRGA